MIICRFRPRYLICTDPVDQIEDRVRAEEYPLLGRQVAIVNDGEDLGQKAEEHAEADEREAQRGIINEPPQPFSPEVGEDPHG
jgi:hypothetical protein